MPEADKALNGRSEKGRSEGIRRLALGAATDVWRREAPCGQGAAGSDFADVVPLGSGRVALVLGDICGRGSAAALHVSQAVNFLRLTLGERTPPARALGRLNRFLCNSDLPAACPAVALSLAVVDVGTGEVVCACAGSEPPLILRAGGGVEAVNAGRVALGVDAKRTYRSVDFLLGAGDALLLATDGVTGARRACGCGGEESEDSPGCERLCYEGLTGLALDAFGAGGPPGQVARAVLDGAREFGGGILHDDASVLVAIRR